MYAVVALPLPFKFHSGGYEGLTYSIPSELTKRALVGSRVYVSLGKRYATGVIVGLTKEKPPEVKKIKPITDVLDPVPVFDTAFLHWSKWVASYYLCSWGEVLETALPEGLRPNTKMKVHLVSKPLDEELAALRLQAPKRAEILAALSEYPNGVFISHLEKRHNFKGIYGQIFALETDGFVSIEKPMSASPKTKKQRVVLLSEAIENDTTAFSNALMEIERTPKQVGVLLKLLQQKQLHPDEPLPQKLLEKQVGTTSAVIATLREKGYIRFEEREFKPIIHEEVLTHSEHDITNILLNDEQQAAITSVKTAIDNGEAGTFLLHGITGSGKTEVYIALAKNVLESGGGVLVLVPEISLTPQLIERFERRLSAGRNINIAVQHSKMSLGERFRSWKMLASGETNICIGARSAVFAPVQNLKLIIVDEEHEMSFKQYDSTPRYHARDAAVMRAHQSGAAAVLGSATPSVESYFNATSGKYQLLTLTKRAQEAMLPKVEIIDNRKAPMRKEQMAKQAAISPQLLEKMKDRLAKKEGIVLLQNRRGFSTYLGCSNCGDNVMCPNCAVTLTYHTVGNRMHCHYCGFMQTKSQVCPTCGSVRLYQGGVGTQRVEEELREILPEARVVRMDLDTTAKKGAYEKILRSFASGEADILLGTQMVAKGLDFPRVTLVGVVNADTSLSLPDFRSGERTFQLLTQVSGRAGRKELPGEVLIQTMQPQHPSIQLAKEHDYVGYFNYELPMRKQLGYPPYSRLVLIEFKGKKEETVRDRAFQFANLFPVKGSFYERLGPSEPTIMKLRNEYRWHLLIKNFRHNDGSGEKLRRLISGALELYQQRHATTAVRVTVDVDVQGVL